MSARVPLTAPAIAATALAILDRRGVEGVTMRAVGDALGVSSMALYHHLSNKHALLAAVVDAAILEEPLPPSSRHGWEHDLRELARWIRRRLLAHPGVVEIRHQARVLTPAAARVSERWLSVWERSGLAYEEAVRAAAVSSRAVVGAIEAEVVESSIAPPSPQDLDPFPSLRAALSLGREDGQAELDRLISALIVGFSRGDA